MSADDTTDQPDLEPSDNAEVDEIADAAEETQSDDATSPAEGKAARHRSGNLPPLVLILLLLISSALATWTYLTMYRPDRQTDAQTVRAVTAAAQDGMVALLSYKSATLDQDVTAAKSHITGNFLNEYEKRIREVVAPAVKGKDMQTITQAIGAGVSELHPDSAVVLVFLNLATVSKDRPDPAMAASTALVSLAKVHDKWLITKFDPI